MSALERLTFTVGIRDLVTPTASSINRTITGMRQNATQGFDAIRGGAVGLAGAGFAIKSFMQPVYDMQKALGEVKSLDVAQKELDTLTAKSLKFSIAYGESATDFVRSSYDIQSAITGLVDGELAKFTNASNILAKGTKADAATITNYMGTMYGIFKDQANKMGKAEWVEQLTGQTAQAVQMFKTTGAEMSGAFTSVGASATSSGISLHEQMAILGTLQSTMSGSEAGTKYKSFLSGVAGAQEKLGLQFTDSAGRMLPMTKILKTLKGRFGDTFSEAESLDLKKAFGSDEAVGLIKLLMGQTDGLSNSITKLGQIRGMDNAVKMAKAMVDPWEQFHATTEAVRIGFGNALLPTINDFLQMLSNGMTTLYEWTQAFPNITKYVGYLTLGILGLGAGVGAFYILMGFAKMAMAAMGAGILILKAGMLGLTVVLGFLKTSFIKLAITMLLNPMILMAFGVIALIAVIGVLIYKWDALVKWFKSTDLGQWFFAQMDSVAEAFSGMYDIAMNIFGKIGDAFSSVSSFFGFGDDSSEINISKSISASGEVGINTLNNARKVESPTDAITKTFVGVMGGGSSGLSFGDVTINADQGMSPDALENWGALQGG
tara:strand:- start:1791 stop:3602 length:1812 start_codon:yes stop_codon:yes gene_type:complete